MSIFLIFGIYSALLAYLIGEGQSLSKLFFDNLNYSLFFGILFWAGITLLLQKSSVKKLESFEFYGVLFIIFLTILAFFVLLPNINLNNILEPPEKDFFNFFIPFGVILFSFLGFNAIPELRMEVGKKTKLLKKAIIAGTLVPVFIYILFSFSVIGFLGNNVSEVATLSFDGFLGKLLYLLGIFTMGSSFFVLSFCLRDYFILDLGRCEKSKLSFFYVSILPLILYILIDFFNLAGFAKILGVGGTVSGGMMGILIILTNFFSKKKGERNPEYSLKINWPIIIFFILLFTLGVLFEIFLI